VWLVSDADDRCLARRTLIIIGLVLATLVGLALVWATRLVLAWIVVAAFFAVALNPLVAWVQRRVVQRRSAATLLVFLGTFVALCALGALILVPLLNELTRFVEQVPTLLRETKAGHGPLAQLLDRFHVQQYAQNHRDQLQNYIGRLGQPTVGFVRGAAQGVAGVLAIVVLAYLMSVAAPGITDRTLAVAGDAQSERLRRIGSACSRTISGYITGNLLISVICGGLTFVVLLLTGVPFAAVLALLVAIADLIPLVGATLGGVVAVGAALLHSLTAGIIVLIFYVVYQQVENHVLQPLVYNRTVRLSPLVVLISVLITAELGGIVGALLAIPAASIVQILLREFVPGMRKTDTPQPAGNHRGHEV
jgi:predicted PurR-regulated permease PerM